MRTLIIAATSILVLSPAVTSANGHAGINTKVPASIKRTVRADTDIPGRVRITGTYGSRTHNWNIRVNQGHGAGSKTQAFMVSDRGKVLAKTPVQVEPPHHGSDSDL